MTYSHHLSQVLQYAREEAQRLGNQTICPDHLLLGIIRHGECGAVQLLQGKGVDLTKVKESIENRIKTSLLIADDQIKNDRQTDRILRLLDLETRNCQAQTANTSHLLFAILREHVNKAATLLEVEYHIDYASLHQTLPIPSQTPRASVFSDLGDDDGDTIATNTQEEMSAATPMIDQYSTDLTLLASMDKLDPIVGRENEIVRVVQILARRKKNNPILIGEPGVGKSAIVEGLAQRIANHSVPAILLGKRIVSLEINAMVSGTKYRGQFEERMKHLIDELKKHPEIILFVDEIHTIVGAGNASGSLDAANILKPALARGEVQCIGATTTAEYKNSIEKDGALERRFQKVLVAPTTQEETLDILHSIAPYYEKHHSVHYSDEAIQSCVELTGLYISDRSFPDKALDALDETGARSQITSPKKLDAITDIENQLHQVRVEKHRVLELQDYEQAVSLRDQERALQTELSRQMALFQSGQGGEPKEVTADDVASVVSLMSGIPLQRLQQDENQRLKSLSDHLRKQVVGQDDAIGTISKAIQRARLGLKDQNRPIGTFLFLGPTGVGKTHLAQSLAQELFGKKDALIRIDMSEYMEKHSVSLLVGAPPGYVAYDEGGKLTEAVRRKPYSIILFDEIEKAHPDVFNLLLQMMDEGRLTDRQGRSVDFRNTIIILTSNVGTRQLKDFGAGVGFASAEEINPTRAQDVIRKALNKTFAPEFINRIDEIVTFSPLSKQTLTQIVGLQIEPVVERLAKKGITLTIDQSVLLFLVEKGYDPQFGARPLRRAIQTYVEDTLTDILLNNPIVSKIVLTVIDGQIVAES